MTDLQECRREIDEIDDEILRLFEKRMQVCEEVASYKIKTGKKVLDPQREKEKINVLKAKAHGEFNALGAQELFQQLMAISRKRQYQLLTDHGVEEEQDYELVDKLPLKKRLCGIPGSRRRLQLCGYEGLLRRRDQKLSCGYLAGSHGRCGGGQGGLCSASH